MIDVAVTLRACIATVIVVSCHQLPVILYMRDHCVLWWYMSRWQHSRAVGVPYTRLVPTQLAPCKPSRLARGTPQLLSKCSTVVVTVWLSVTTICGCGENSRISMPDVCCLANAGGNPNHDCSVDCRPALQADVLKCVEDAGTISANPQRIEKIQ